MEKLKVNELVKPPVGCKHISTRWIFRVKGNKAGEIETYEARWVVKRYMRSHGLYFNLTHAPVSRLSTLRVLLFLAVKSKLKIIQMDICTEFLNTILDDAVYVLLPPGFEHLVPKGKSLMLLKALFGLKQASRAWNQLSDGFLIDKAGMTPRNADKCLYKRCNKGIFELVVLVYVYDIRIMSSDANTLNIIREVYTNVLK